MQLFFWLYCTGFFLYDVLIFNKGNCDARIEVPLWVLLIHLFYVVDFALVFRTRENYFKKKDAAFNSIYYEFPYNL